MTVLDTSENIDHLRSANESEQQWQLRKKFLMAHRHKYEEGRLTSLSQIFVNIYFLGSKYAEPITELINKLSEGIIEKTGEWDGRTSLPTSAPLEEKIKAVMYRPMVPNYTPVVNCFESPDEDDWEEDMYIPKQYGTYWNRGQKRAISIDDEFSSERGLIDTISYKRLRVTNVQNVHLI